MANLAAKDMDDVEGAQALVVADDGDLGESMSEVLGEFGYGVRRLTFCSAPRALLEERKPYTVAVLCIGRGLPETMHAVNELLASAALTGAEVLLGITAAEHEFPALPAAGRASSVAFLRMPFDLTILTHLERERVAVARLVPVRRSAALVWDGAVEQRLHAGSAASDESYEWALWMDSYAEFNFENMRDAFFATAC